MRTIAAREIQIGMCVRYRSLTRRAMWVEEMRPRPRGGIYVAGTRARVTDGVRLVASAATVLLADTQVDVLAEAENR